MWHRYLCISISIDIVTQFGFFTLTTHDSVFLKTELKPQDYEFEFVRTNSRSKHLYANSCIIIQNIVVPFSTISIAIGFYSVLPLWLAYLCYSISNEFTFTIKQGAINRYLLISFAFRVSHITLMR